MITVNLASYQPWYNTLAVLLFAGLVAVAWTHTLAGRYTTWALRLTASLWAGHAVLAFGHHWFGWPQIHY